jgi:hypothetical protein
MLFVMCSAVIALGCGVFYPISVMAQYQVVIHQSLNHPTGVAFDQYSNVHVADTSGNRIVKWNSNGVLLMTSNATESLSKLAVD